MTAYRDDNHRDSSTRPIAEVEVAEEPEWGVHRDARGIHILEQDGDGGPVRRCDIL